MVTDADSDSDFALAALRKFFKFDAFRPGQREVVEAAVAGRDVMTVMPTGGGKSVCYQLPAARIGTFTLVVTPLRALMRDQVQHLDAAGIPAALIDSGLSEGERAGVYARALAGVLRILYVAPERLNAPDFRDFIHRMRVDVLAVDEAHCMLQWGGDFRPSYLNIGGFAASLTPRPVIMALTATASREQADEICRMLGMRDPLRYTGDADRPNLTLHVVHVRPRERRRMIIRWACTHQGSGIIYKESRKGVEELAGMLREEGVDAEAFHAEMRDEDKRRIQDGFLNGSPRVICATSAFGMGVDKPDVRWVLNDGPCKSLEAYWQEAGRAGRDGGESDCVLYWSEGDWKWLRDVTDQAMANAEASGDSERIGAARKNLERLDAMSEYCEETGCLRRLILKPFDSEGVRRGDCGKCSNCLHLRSDYMGNRNSGKGHHRAGGRRDAWSEPTNKEWRTEAAERYRKAQAERRANVGIASPSTGRMASAGGAPHDIGDKTRIVCAYIDAVGRKLGYYVGADLLADALKGVDSRRVRRHGLDQIEGYGALPDMDRPAFIDLFQRMEALQATRFADHNEVRPGALFDMYLKEKNS
ncbi:RecQ family ATP-dependent DNA helicase [Bifidobacterium imperatoris]|nr:RecQ family ATP-dependent DNA helicase [Bifidobacterium imperatoris]QSY57718.1 RecQ family ATP-dependent DNA helicase [Bifidobacterium imperatoris]